MYTHRATESHGGPRGKTQARAPPHIVIRDGRVPKFREIFGKKIIPFFGRDLIYCGIFSGRDYFPETVICGPVVCNGRLRCDRLFRPKLRGAIVIYGRDYAVRSSFTADITRCDRHLRPILRVAIVFYGRYYALQSSFTAGITRCNRLLRP